MRATKEELYKYYVEEDMTMTEIAPIYEVSYGAVRKWLIKYEIPLKGQGHVRASKEAARREKIRVTSEGRTVSDETREKIRQGNLGKPKSEAHRQKLSEIKKGKPAFNKGKKSPYPAWNKGKPNPMFMGDKNPRWKGGITSENKKARETIEVQQWRKDVFERDNYTCQECKQRGGKLHAYHIKPFVTFPELRTDLTNGRTLCVSCHRNTPTYGSKALKFTPEYYNSI